MNTFFDYENCIVPLLNKMLEILNNETYSKVIWIGENESLGLIREVLDFYNYKIDIVVDSNLNKEGRIIPCYGRELSELRIDRIDYIKLFGKGAIYFSANSHAAEIRGLLNDWGIPSDRYFDLYLLSDYSEIIEKPLQNMFKGINHEFLSIHELQKVELNLLLEFRNFCDSNKLKYFLAGGTLIGAVRHQGFIPWDDDIDVYMPYEDWLRFINTYEDNDRYALINWHRLDSFILEATKLVDLHTMAYTASWPYILKYGVRIDVFPLGGYPSEESLVKEKWLQNGMLTHKRKVFHILRDLGKKVDDPRINVEKIKFQYSFYESSFVGTMTTARQKPWISKVECFEKTVELDFENHKFKVPVGYDEHLKYRYGDYMQLPPKEERVAHGMKAWRI